MLRISALRRRGLTLLALAALTGALLALVPASAHAGCRTALARACLSPQTITFPALADVRVDQGPVALGAYSTVENWTRVAARTPVPTAPGSPIVYTSTTTSVCTVAGATAVLVSAGTCSITANAGAASWWDDADPVVRAFQVLALPVAPVVPTVPAPAPTPAKPTVTLTVPTGLPLSAGAARAKARSTGAGAVVVKSSSPTVCRVSSTGTISLVKAGTCRLSATQAGADPVTASFPVWPFPALPARARSTQVLDVLGKGEQGYRVRATPADVCRTADGGVALIDGGVCRIQVVDGDGVVRTDRVRVVVPTKPTTPQHALDLGAKVYFAFDSSRLTSAGKVTLRKVAPVLRKADLVVVYGHTFGPGKNSPSSRALAADRARVTVAYLDKLGVKSKVVSEVAMAMQQPASSTAWRNRRAEVYYQ